MPRNIAQVSKKIGPSEHDHVRTSDVQLAIVIPFCQKFVYTSENVSATGNNSIYGKVKLFKGQ